MTFECASGDWVRKKDAGTSTFYYANVISRVSSWTVPPDWVEPAAPTSATQSENWRELRDDKTGNMYYVNLVTMERSWVKPSTSPTTTTSTSTTPAGASVTVTTTENLPPLELRKPPDFDTYPAEDIYSSDEEFKGMPNGIEGAPAGLGTEKKEKFEVPKSPRSQNSTTYYGFDPVNLPSSTLASAAAFSPKLVFKASELQSTPRLEQAALMAKATGPAEKSGTVRAIKVFLSDERAYFQDLQVIAMEFEATLANQKKGQGADKELLNPAEIKMILKNIPDLFALHLHFTQDVSEYRSDAQLLSPELVEILTNLVMSLEPYAFYASAYKRDCKSVLQSLERWELDRPAVKATLDHIRSTKCLSGIAKPIAYYLDAPSSRPATYGGLVFNILKTVDPLTESFKLWHDLLQKCEFVSQKIEENAHYISSRESVSDIQRRLHFVAGSEFSGLNLVTPSRYLVQSGEVRKKMDKARLGSSYKSYILYVFNDVAMYTSPPDKSRRITPKHIFQMTDLRVESSRKDVNFRLSSPVKSVQFKVASREERDQWVKVVQECIKAAREPVENNSNRPQTRRESGRKHSTSRGGWETGRKQSISVMSALQVDSRDREISVAPSAFSPSASSMGDMETYNTLERHLTSANSLTSIDQREDVIKINVGGTLFHTSPGTLLNKSNHTHGFLTDLVARALNQDHPVFLDRDPEYFRVALNYLRTGRLVLPAGMSSVLMSAELAFCGIAEPPVSVGRFAQWSQGSMGECRRFEFTRTHCDCFTADGRFKVCDSARWLEPFDNLVWRGLECAPAVIMAEMGKYGWEVKGYCSGGDITNYVIQKSDNETYLPNNEATANNKKTSLRNMRKKN